MVAGDLTTTALQQRVWSGSLPLEIRLAAADCRKYEDSQPYLVHCSRLSYLGFLLPRLHRFFKDELINLNVLHNEAWLEYDGVPLRWHYALGLLYDLYAGAQPVNLEAETVHTFQQEHERGVAAGPIPWRITIHYSDFPHEHLIPLDSNDKVLQDAWINTVKEADFLRNGTARTVMSLSKDDSDKLWQAVRKLDLDDYNTVNNKLIYPRGIAIKHIPVKIYLPASPPQTTASIPEEQPGEVAPRSGHFRVVQALTPLTTSSGAAQTVGTALNNALPDIFPSRRQPLLAQPVLHGAILPMAAPLEMLARSAAYLDGFIHLAVVMLT